MRMRDYGTRPDTIRYAVFCHYAIRLYCCAAFKLRVLHFNNIIATQGVLCVHVYIVLCMCGCALQDDHVWLLSVLIINNNLDVCRLKDPHHPQTYFRSDLEGQH